MSNTVIGRDLSKLMEGVDLKVYPNADGKQWHAHVSVPYSWGAPFEKGWRENSGYPQCWWTDVRGISEDDARAKACEVAGAVYGKRLLEALKPVEVPAKVIPAPREVRL